MSICPICNSQLVDSQYQCPICGFRLTGSTQAFDPVVVDPDSGSLSTSVATSVLQNSLAQFRVVKGPQVGNTILLRGERLTIGRSPQCDVFLNDMTVSRLHATLVRTKESFIIEDQDSYNGLWVNNINVKSAELADGDVVQIGTFSLVFQICAR